MSASQSSAKVNLREKLSTFTDQWSPKIVASYNGNDIMVVRVEGEFVWHSHPDTDDFFLIIDGELDIELRDRTVTLGPGELFVVPTGVEHRPVARRGEVKVMLIEPTGTPTQGTRRPPPRKSQSEKEGSMFSHIVVGSNDIDRSKKFYDALFEKDASVDPKGRIAYRRDGAAFMVTKPIDGQPAHHANGGTIGFNFGTPEEVDAWHQRGVAAGGASCEDPPGYREGSFGKLYLAYLRDPDGNKLCGLHRPTQ